MKNINVYKNKLHLPEKYINEPAISLMLRKPGTLSKREKQWLISYVALLELRDIKPNIPRDHLSEEFVQLLIKNKRK
jgi:hypothetical protein